MSQAAQTLDLSNRILVVDDDPGIRELTAGFLSAHGYQADQAEDAVAMREALARHSYQLIVLDVMMPGEDGLSVLRSMDRATAPAIIVVSVIGQDVDRIVGLEMGADDYLAKPANPRELLARIRSVLRRRGERPVSGPTPRAPDRPMLRFAGWRLDPMGRQLFDPEDVLINLSDGEFRLLMAFADHPRRVLTRDFLLDASRGVQAEHFDRAIDVQVSRLRRKLGRDEHGGGQAGGDELIRTVRNEGYMFTADVERR